jgi:hypothetical protein
MNKKKLPKKIYINPQETYQYFSKPQWDEYGEYKLVEAQLLTERLKSFIYPIFKCILKLCGLDK